MGVPAQYPDSKIVGDSVINARNKTSCREVASSLAIPPELSTVTQLPQPFAQTPQRFSGGGGGGAGCLLAISFSSVAGIGGGAGGVLER